MKILTQKFAILGFLEVEGKKMVLGVWIVGFCTKNSNLCELAHTWALWSFQLEMSVFCVEKEQNFYISNFWAF